MKKNVILYALLLSMIAVSKATMGGDGTAYANQYLFPGQRLTQGCYYGLIMQLDGNLVTYNNFGNQYSSANAEWSSDTFNRGGYAVMQTDGNFVIYNWADAPVWATNTAGYPGARVVQQDDGNLVVYLSNIALWASGATGESGGQNNCGSPQTKTIVTENFDRPGGDYKGLILNEARPSWCGYFCSQDMNCRSYTYVPPGIQDKKAVCWLKGSIPLMKKRVGMVSGKIIR